MSYIRAYSNPEGLYIWAENGGKVYISHNVCAPHASREPQDQDFLIVPRYIFEKVCLGWDGYREKISFRGLKVEELYVCADTGKVIRTPIALSKAPLRIVIRFSYDNRFFHMWPTTWEYIVNGVQTRYKHRK